MDPRLAIALLALTGCAGASGAEDPSCAALRRGVEVCDPSPGGFTCAGLPDAYRACAELAPQEPDDDACAAFMGCLYDGPS